MAEIEVELKYWQNDLEQRGKFNSVEKDVKNISEKYGIDIKVFTEQEPAIHSMRKIIKISGSLEPTFRNSIRDIVTLFGIPNLPSFVFGGSKKKGKEIAKSVVEELTRK